MTLIYSSTSIKGLKGCYIDPFRFDNVEKSATKVYADDESIISAYKKCGIEVSLITNKNEPKEIVETKQRRNKVSS